MEQILLAKPVVAKIITMVGGDDNHRVIHLPGIAKMREQMAHLIIDLLDQPHIGAKRGIAHLILPEGGADDIAGKGGIDRMLVDKFIGVPDHRHKAVRTIHVVIGRRHDIGPVRLDIGQMAHPGSLALRRALVEEVDHLAGQPRCLGILLADIRRLVGIRIDPARGDIAIIINPGIGKIMPGILRLIALLAEIFIIGGRLVIIIAVRTGGPQPVITDQHIKAAFGKPRTNDAVGGKAKALHAVGIDLHMRLADQQRVHAGLAEVIPHRPFTNPQRDAVPGRAVRADIAAGVEGHP